jgi:hypothetical protein
MAVGVVRPVPPAIGNRRRYTRPVKPALRFCADRFESAAGAQTFLSVPNRHRSALRTDRNGCAPNPLTRRLRRHPCSRFEGARDGERGGECTTSREHAHIGPWTLSQSTIHNPQSPIRNPQWFSGKSLAWETRAVRIPFQGAQPVVDL